MASFSLGALVAVSLSLSACGGSDSPADPLNPVTKPDPVTVPTMVVTGRGTITNRYSAEVWARGNHAYTTTWGSRGNPQVPGNTIYIWDVRAAPILVDSTVVPDVRPETPIRTLGDVQVSDDGKLLVVPTELTPGSIEIYDLTDPVKPRSLARFTSPNMTRGVHTCELQRVNGTLYAFLSVNNATTHPSRLMIVDLSDPSKPTEVMFRDMGNPFIHDVFVRDGLLFTALWNDGMVIWDIGGGGKGGTLRNPVEIGRLVTKNGEVHNIWWFHDPVTAEKKYAFVGEEAPGALLSASSGDIHVVDISNPALPREVAFFSAPGAGTHNFSMDEARGLLYAAYYNGGVQVLDVRGNLGTCTAAQKSADGRCDLRLMNRLVATGLLNQNTPVYVWGVFFAGDAVYASDMNNGIWKLAPVTR